MDVTVTLPSATVNDQLPAACAEEPVTYTWTNELVLMYASVMTHVLLFAPHVPVFNCLLESGGRLDCGL